MHFDAKDFEAGIFVKQDAFMREVASIYEQFSDKDLIPAEAKILREKDLGEVKELINQKRNLTEEEKQLAYKKAEENYNEMYILTEVFCKDKKRAAEISKEHWEDAKNVALAGFAIASIFFPPSAALTTAEFLVTLTATTADYVHTNIWQGEDTLHVRDNTIDYAINMSTELVMYGWDIAKIPDVDAIALEKESLEKFELNDVDDLSFRIKDSSFEDLEMIKTNPLSPDYMPKSIKKTPLENIDLTEVDDFSFRIKDSSFENLEKIKTDPLSSDFYHSYDGFSYCGGKYSVFGRVEDGKGPEYLKFLENGPREVPEIQRVRISNKSLVGNNLSEEDLYFAKKYGQYFVNEEMTLTNSLDPQLQNTLTDVAYRSSCPFESNYEMTCLTNDGFRVNLSKADVDNLSLLEKLRKEMPQPDNQTVLMKVLNKNRYDSFASYTQLTQEPIYGCMASAKDTAPYIRCPNDAFVELRLDFSMNEIKVFKETVEQNKSIKILIRQFDGWDVNANEIVNISDRLNIPHIDSHYKPPITEVGITASPLHLHPEYGANSIIPNEAVIFDLSPDGVLTLDAVYNKTDKIFNFIR